MKNTCYEVIDIKNNPNREHLTFKEIFNYLVNEKTTASELFKR